MVWRPTSIEPPKDKTQPEIPEVIPEVEEDEESAGESTEESEISDNQDKQEAENSEKKDSITDKKSVQEMVWRRTEEVLQPE